MTQDYAVIFEKSATGWAATCPDLGCVVIGDSFEDAVTLITESIQFNIESRMGRQIAIPQPCATVKIGVARVDLNAPGITVSLVNCGVESIPLSA